MFVSLNELSANCRGPNVYVSSPADFSAYGQPILYLIVQILLLFGFLLWHDSGNALNLLFRKRYRDEDNEEHYSNEPDVLKEIQRVETSDDGLKVLHLTKAYGNNVAVKDVSFGIKHGEVFALLGPNGAGKSTTVSCVRGDILPSPGSGDILVEGVSMLRKKAAARQLLGNCPQFDAMDQLTVLEHLRFYARIRGVKNVEANVKEVVRGVGLTNFQNRMGAALSGGNKRKLSLGIALMGNPAVMLLDEISSGLDVAAKRILWRTLETVVPGRSIALITHSMEEADRLCRRAGIMAKKMLAVGTVEDLRQKHGNRYHVHILLNSAPQTSSEETERALNWASSFAGAEVENSFHGQLRFSVPAESQSQEEAVQPASAIATLFRKLEDSKKEVGFEYYSVGQTTLDQVFLSIVGKHQVQEEGYATTTTTTTTKEKKNTRSSWWRLKF
jgi:ATP-binding cassette, subfamily A (ABC1), member 3